MGFPNINDNAEIAELIACGAHLVLFTTGRGSVVGSAISPVVKVCANPETYRRMADDMDVDAGRILEGAAGLDDVADEILDLVLATAAGAPTASRGARAPGVRAHLQVLRADRARVPARWRDDPVRRPTTGRPCGRPCVHVGPGVFHRAHQAVYADTLLRSGGRSGAIWAVSLRSSAVRDALARNGFVYHLVERPSGDARPIGALLGIDVAAEGIEPALARLTDPAVTVVTVTVTEHGYCAVGPGGPLDPTRARGAARP